MSFLIVLDVLPKYSQEGRYWDGHVARLVSASSLKE